MDACPAPSARIEEKYSVPVLHVDFAKKEHSAQMNGLITEDRLRRMMDGRYRYAIDTVYSLVASSWDRNLGSA